jgi:2-aminoadipate transaminase
MSGFKYGPALSSSAQPVSTVSPRTPPANGAYQFGGGKPDPVSLPFDGLTDATAHVLETDGPDALTYGDAQGYAPLRALIARKYATFENLTVDPAQIVVTNGSSDAIRLVCLALLEPGDTVLVEAPTFMGSLRTISGHRPKVVGVPMDDQGLIIEELEAVIQRERAAGGRLKLLYVIPTFQNPSGVTMPLDRRKALLEVATREGLVVMEDDAYGDLRCSGEFIPSLFSLDTNGVVVRTGTMSKILAAGLRVGWMVAQPDLVAAVLRVKFEGGTSPFLTRIVTTYMADHMDQHVADLIEVYRAKRDAMLESLEEHVGRENGAAWSQPDGGFFIWVRLPDGTDVNKLADACTARGVSYVPGPAFYVDWQKDWPDADRYIRLAFSFSQPDEIRAGIAHLGRAILLACG